MAGVGRPALGSEAGPLAKCRDIAELRNLARKRTPLPVFDYVDGGADEEVSIAANQAAFRRFAFTPDSLVDVSSCDTTTRMFNSELAFPLILAPTGYSRMMHPDGELAVASAAKTAGIPYVLSTVTSTSIEDVAGTGCDPRWFQLYIWKDRGMTLDLVSRADRSGYGVLELSVDTPVPGYRIRDIRNGLTIPPRLSLRAFLQISAHPRYWMRLLRSPALEFANAPAGLEDQGVTVENMTEQFDPSITWERLAEIRSQWPGKLMVKGPLKPEDAMRAMDSGADGIHLSNHGGRQLDRTIPPIDLCPSIRDAIGDDVTLVVDSGIRHGSDLAIAIARGADAGAVGRAYLYGLMAGGEQGVARAIELLQSQFLRTMQLLGTRSVAELRERGDNLIMRFHQEEGQ